MESYIKVFMTRYALQEFHRGKQVIVKPGFQSAEDIEVYLKLTDIDIIYQQRGMVVRKRRFIFRLFPFLKKNR